MLNDHTPTHRVLIVDDEYVPRSLESFALEGTGRYYVVEASNATDALTALSGQEFDAAVIDMSMPDMTGIELIRMIRRSLEYGNVPIVLVMPRESDGDSEEVEACGADEIIAKPFDPWDLARVLDTLTGALTNSDHVLSVDAVLRGFPYPTMILDASHHVLVANGSFYESTGTGVDECYVTCNHEMHDDGEIPSHCPLNEAVRTGQSAERLVETRFGRMRVSVYPLSITTGSGERLFLHVTQPAN